MSTASRHGVNTDDGTARPRHRRGKASAVAFAVLALWGSRAGAASLLPLDSEDALLLPTGRIETTVGTRYLRDVQPPFTPGVKREQWSAPELGVSGGLGSRVEVQFRWEALSISDEIPGQTGTVDEYGTGDARFFTKIRFFSEGAFSVDWFPATSFHFGVKLPDANRRKGLGTDEADFFGRFLLSKSIGPLRLLGNIGMGILGNPGPARGQDDVVLWSAAAVGPWLGGSPDFGVQFLGEATGIESSRYENEFRRASLGLRVGSERLAGLVGGSVGLDHRSEDFGLRLGLIWAFDAFQE